MGSDLRSFDAFGVKAEQSNYEIRNREKKIPNS